MLIDIHEASRDLIEARERLGPAVYYRLDLWERLKELALPADATPKPPAGGDAGAAGEVARIILISEDHGCQTHGLFASFDDALAHAKKDGAPEEARWTMTSPDRGCFLDGAVFWTASREPVRAATPKPPAGDAKEWDHRYRPLRLGETILATDECRRDDGTWVTGICVGEKAPDPAYTSHRVYRRLKTLDVLQKAEALLKALEGEPEEVFAGEIGSEIADLRQASASAVGEV